MKLSYWLMGCLWLLAVTTARVRAQEPQYRELVAQAVEEYRAGRFDEAAAFFSRAHAIKPSARTHRGLGKAYFEARKYALAVRHLREALSDERRPLTPEQRQDVQAALEQALAIVSQFQMTLEPPGAALEVDGSPAVVHDGALLLDPGRHEITATAPGYRRRRRIVDAQGGASRALVIELEPQEGGAAVAAAAPAPEPGAQAATDDEAPVASQPGGAAADTADDGAGFAEGRLWTWVALGGAGAFGAAALVFGLVGNAQYDDLMEQCEDGCSDEQIEREIDDSGVKSSAVLANVSLALSGACLATAVALYFVEGPADSESPTVAAAPSVAAALGPGGFRLSGRF